MRRFRFSRSQKRSIDSHRSQSLRTNKLHLLEQLETRALLDASVVISEISAINDDLLFDEDGDSPDWFELLNVSNETVELNGWYVTDEADNLNEWQFPAVSLTPGEHLVVFASGKDRDNPTRPLHTDFKLSGDGEYLALVRPDETIEFEFAPNYPQQVENVSFGIPNQITQSNLVNEGAVGWFYVPTDSTLDPNGDQISGSWLDPALDVVAGPWTPGASGLGFRDEASDPNPGPGDGEQIASSQDEFSQFQNRDRWRYGYWDAAEDENGVYETNEFESFVWSGLTTITNFNHWDGTKWDLAADPKTPNTELTAEGGTPSGVNSGGVQYAVRRWTSEVDGAVLLHGRIENLDGSGDGVVARVFVDGEEVYYRAVNGVGVDYQVVASVQDGSKVDFVIDPGAVGNDEGDRATFTTTIEDVTAVVGELGGIPTLADHISTDLSDEMQGVSSSVYLRIPFTVNSAQFDSLTLRMKYDDAFVAYLNGQPIASSGGPMAVEAAWDSVADQDRSVEEALRFESFNATQFVDALQVGSENVLMVHGINRSVENGDFLILPELVATTLEIDPAARRYFVAPSPGNENGLGDANAGPIFVDHSFSPEAPAESDPIVVTARVTNTFHPISKVEMSYRVMYGSTRKVRMVDDGSGNDAVANDGIFTATIPARSADPGEMVRWFFEAEDNRGQTTRLPRFELSRDSEQYFGTVIVDPALSSELPIFHWFVQSRSRAFSSSGTQGSIYYDGEFYDNVSLDLHGQSSSGFPTVKKSLNIDLPKDHRFRLRDDIPRMKDFNWLTNFADKSKLRNTLAHEQRALIGDGYHLAFPVRVQHNGEFFAVYDFVEDGDNRWLERLGMDPEGALYKMYNRMDSASGEKKTRRFEGNTDLRDLVSGIRQSSNSRTDFIYDNIDLAAMANYLAGFVLTSNRDCCHKNYYAFRDTNGTGQWRYMPWDVDLSQGRNWGGFGRSYFDDTIYPDNPLYMGGNNSLISALYAIPDFKEMYLRRVRTVVDQYFKPLNTPYAQRPLETRVDELVELLQVDADLDNQRHRATWGQTGFQTFNEATDILKAEYAQPRREFLYLTQMVPDDSETRVIVSGEREETLIRYFIPRNNSLGSSWTGVNFNDSSWKTGPNGIGFERTSGAYDDLIATNIRDEIEGLTSAYVRIPFELETLADVEQLTLRMKYDDGFIAYLNGTEVARRGVGDDAASYDLRSRTHSDSLAVNYENMSITPFINRLRVGENVLAIQAINASSISSDMLMIPELVEGSLLDSDGEIPTAQVGNPQIDFSSLEFNPSSGNQDEEFVQLTNNNSFAVDISGWQLRDGIEWTFQPGTVIPAGGSLYVTPSVPAFLGRTEGPSGGQRLFVQGNYAGHLSNFGETIELVGADGNLVNSWSYEGQLTPLQEHLRLTELMYRPLAPSTLELAQNSNWIESDFEFVELMNTSAEMSLDLTGVRITNGVEFAFPEGFALPPQQHTVIVANRAAFEARYGNPADQAIAGEFAAASRLRDSGETLKLEDGTSSTIVEFAFDDDQDRGWPLRADGRGSSLQIVDWQGDYGNGRNWRPSSRIHGTPGSGADSVESSLMINEVVSSSQDPLVDAVELVNIDSAAVQLDHYYLSDTPTDADSFGRFKLPAVNLAVGGFLVLNEGDFNPPENPNGFAFNGTRGDEIYLLRGDADGPIDFVDAATFPASVPDESFGRVQQGPLAPLSSISLGAANVAYRVGPIILSEFNYHPSDPSVAALNLDAEIEAEDLEFLELHNSGVETVTLTDWRIRGDVDFDFPTDATLAPGETVLVLRFNPDREDNSARVAAFRAEYDLGNEVRLLGGFQGSLDNAGHRITMQRPGAIVEGDPTIPRLWEDEVRFDDVAPWPTSADGQGESLQRVSSLALGLQVESWFAAAPTPGHVDFAGLPGDLNGDGIRDLADIDLFSEGYRVSPPDLSLDLTADGSVNEQDRDYFITELMGIEYGDSNLDGVFNSTDLIRIFTFGEYEDNLPGNSTWAEGDWNMDGDFNSSDLIVAFIRGAYTVGARPVTALSISEIAASRDALDWIFADDDATEWFDNSDR